MSMIVNMTEKTQRDSDTEEREADDERNVDEYSTKGGASGDDDEVEEEVTGGAVTSPVENTEASPKQKVKFELTNFESSNALLHTLYTQGDYNECKSLIGEMQEQLFGQSEAAMAVRAAIARHEGQLEEAAEWFTKALKISGNDPKYYTELGRVYYLMGRHKQAVEVLEKAVKSNPKDSKGYYWLARSVYHLDTDLFNTTEKARDILIKALDLVQNVDLVVFLGRLQAELGDPNTAIQAYSKALELEPENLDLMFALGMLHLKNGSEDPAFAMFGKALSYDPTHQQSILAVGYIMQLHGDNDVALNKYRVASDRCDYNGCLWNNIAICLFAKGKLAAAHSCLKKAAFIRPLDYRINYNLGMVHSAMGMYCSALHHLKAAADLKKDNSQILGAMAVVLSNMNDVKNARRAYQKAVQLDPKPQTLLNYAIFEYNHDDKAASMEALKQFKTLSTNAQYRQDLLTQGERLEDLLLTPPKSSTGETVPVE